MHIHVHIQMNTHTKMILLNKTQAKRKKISFSELPDDGVKLSIPEFHIMQHARPHARTLFKKGVK